MTPATTPAGPQKAAGQNGATVAKSILAPMPPLVRYGKTGPTNSSGGRGNSVNCAWL